MGFASQAQRHPCRERDSGKLMGLPQIRQCRAFTGTISFPLIPVSFILLRHRLHCHAISGRGGVPTLGLLPYPRRRPGCENWIDPLTVVLLNFLKKSHLRHVISGLIGNVLGDCRAGRRTVAHRMSPVATLQPAGDQPLRAASPFYRAITLTPFMNHCGFFIRIRQNHHREVRNGADRDQCRPGPRHGLVRCLL